MILILSEREEHSRLVARQHNLMPTEWRHIFSVEHVRGHTKDTAEAWFYDTGYYRKDYDIIKTTLLARQIPIKSISL